MSKHEPGGRLLRVQCSIPIAAHHAVVGSLMEGPAGHGCNACDDRQIFVSADRIFTCDESLGWVSEHRCKGVHDSGKASVVVDGKRASRATTCGEVFGLVPVCPA